MNITIEETKQAYSKVFGTECSTEEAEEHIHKFKMLIKLYDRWEQKRKHEVVSIKFSKRPETIKEYLTGLLDQQKKDEARRQHHDYIMSLSPTERFLQAEGFNDEFGIALQKSIDETTDGQALIELVCSIGFQCETQDIAKSTLEFISTQFPEKCNKATIQLFLDSEEGKSTMVWFQAIMGDGERALRAIHMCAKAFCKYCDKQWKFSYAISRS